MTESSAVTPEKAAEWAALAERWSANLNCEIAELCTAVPALLAEREQLLSERSEVAHLTVRAELERGPTTALCGAPVTTELPPGRPVCCACVLAALGTETARNAQLLARLEQQRADLAIAYEQLHNAEQRINDGIKLAVAARTAVPDAPYTGVGWHPLLAVLAEPEVEVRYCGITAQATGVEVTCELPAGHERRHQRGEVSWPNVGCGRPVPDHPFGRCVRWYGHDDPHAWGNARW